MDYKDEIEQIPKERDPNEKDPNQSIFESSKFIKVNFDPDQLYYDFKSAYNSENIDLIKDMLEKMQRYTENNMWLYHNSFDEYQIPLVLIDLGFEKFKMIDLRINTLALQVIAQFMDPVSCGHTEYFLNYGIIDAINKFITVDGFPIQYVLEIMIGIVNYSEEAIDQLFSTVGIDVIIDLYMTSDAGLYCAKLLYLFKVVNFENCDDSIFESVLNVCQEFLVRNYSKANLDEIANPGQFVPIHFTDILFDTLTQLCTSLERYNIIRRIYYISEILNACIPNAEYKTAIAALRLLSKFSLHFTDMPSIFPIDYRAIIGLYESTNIPSSLSEQILHTIYDMVACSEQSFIFMTQSYNIIPVLIASYKTKRYTEKALIFDICVECIRHGSETLKARFMSNGIIEPLVGALTVVDDEKRVTDACYAIHYLPNDIKSPEGLNIKYYSLLALNAPELVIDLLNDDNLEDSTYEAVEMLASDPIMKFLIDNDCPTDPEDE